MAVVAEFVADVFVGIKPFKVSFTDTSTGSPDHWLWEFGDGFLSTDQNPTHIYRENGDFSVKLTSWIQNSTPNIGAIHENYALGTNVSGYIYSSYATAKAGFLDGTNNDITTFGSGTPRVGFVINRSGVSTLWSWQADYFDRIVNIGGADPDVDVCYIIMMLGINYGTGTLMYSYDPTSGRGGRENYTEIRIGKVNGDTFDSGNSVFDLKYLPQDGATIFPIYNLEPYFGITGDQSFRATDGRLNISTNLYVDFPSDPTPYRALPLGSLTQYQSNTRYPFWVWSKALSGNKDVITKVNYITANDNVITRPAQLYSGIKEAYFKDGWENEKHFYLEQSTAHPCVVQFVDIYADTENEK